MKKYKWYILLLNLFLILAYFNWGIVDKEAMLKDGELVLLELAPIDPRSLMQGDYMHLRYSLSEREDLRELPKRGYCIVRLDANNVASLVRYQDNITPINPGEILLKYAKKGYGTIVIGADSFFFQEGQAKKYEEAKYAGLKIDAAGNSLLIGLYDSSLKAI